LLFVIKKTLGLRVSGETELKGLDKIVLKEEAMSFEEGALFNAAENTVLAMSPKGSDLSELKSPSTALGLLSIGELKRLRRVHVEPPRRNESLVELIKQQVITP